MSVAADSALGTGELVRPAWRRLRLWVGLAVTLVIAAAVVTVIRGGSTGPLDPNSPSHSGSKALAVLLGDYGIPVERTTSLSHAASAPAGSTVVVPVPSRYSADQLAELARGEARLVVARPTDADLDVLGSPLSEASLTGGHTQPGCPAPGAQAAGTVALPPDSRTYDAPPSSGLTSCYYGAVVLGPRLAVLGSAALLRNDTLVDTGVAALDVNVLSDNRTTRRVVWLVPGQEATNAAAPSYWDLFPDGARRAFLWLLPFGLLIILWRGRRFGPVVTEPLPVVVRSAEVVEGHGRLYRRAGARDRAATALRAGSVRRLATHAGLQRGAALPEIAAAVASLAGRPEADVAQLLGGPLPVDDHALVVLALQLDALEDAAGVPPRPKGHRS